MELSCAFPPGAEVADLAVVAERLGYRRIWCYDSPALYSDVWMSLTRIAERTREIGLGPGVMIPSLRHPMVTAAAVATLEALAPGRTSLAIGSGFTGRLAMGKSPMKWDDVASYVDVLRTLLRGEDAKWDDAVIRMMQTEGFGTPRPVSVPILIGADGPKGYAVAEALGDGVMGRRVPPAEFSTQRVSVVQIGTVLGDGEDCAAQRVLETVGPGVLSIYHGAYSTGGREAVVKLPGGDRWADEIERTAPELRHLAVHAGHAVAANAADRFLLAECAPMIQAHTLTGGPTLVHHKLEKLASRGVDEVVFQPAGTDLERELAEMARAAGLAARSGAMR